jgi:hypothetical protein
MKKSTIWLLSILLSAACLQQKNNYPVNMIVTENLLPGTLDWLIEVEYDTCSPPEHAFCRRPQIEGYCSQASINQGDTLGLFVSTNPSSQFTLDIYRMGYYQGKGGNLKRSIGPLQGKTQVEPNPDPLTNFFECNWDETYRLIIPQDWLSGVYLCKLTTIPDKYQSYIIFLVKDNRKVDFIFQCSDLTWQSYNRWPYWHSLYDEAHIPWKGASETTVTRSSFDRPYALYVNLLPSGFNPLSNGAGEFLLWEFPLSYWMEQKGFDVTYISNIDTHADSTELHRAKAFLSVGHDEYWTYDMFNNVSNARDKGVNLLFLSGNSVSGAVYLDPSTDKRPNRIMGRTTGEDLKDTSLMGATSYGVGYGSFICQEPAHWLFEGTGMQKGDSITNLIGWEYHGRPTGGQKDLLVVGETKINPAGFGPINSPHQITTIYTTDKGNFVFNAGTCWWVQLLAKTPAYQHSKRLDTFIDFSTPDPRIQQMTLNLFKKSLENNQ